MPPAPDLKTVESLDLSPFKKMVMTIGNLPTAFVESMTYYECLAYFVDYLKNTVIPTINNNAEAIEELQGLYITLHNYVKTYFDNLDVQEEVNVKLDAMVEDGTMDRIINQEIFGNINNSISTLNEQVSTLNSQVSTLNSQVSTLNTYNLTELVVIGDSYTAFSSSTWAEDLADALHLNLHKFATSSMGYVHDVDGHTFIDNIPNNPDYRMNVKYFICYGGVNDYDSDITETQIENNVDLFVQKAKETFPNAQIILAGPQKDISISTTATQRFQKEMAGIARGAAKNGVCYVNASDWLINTLYPYNDLYANDNLHPSALGYKIIAGKMLSVINNETMLESQLNVTLHGNLTGRCLIKSSFGHTHFQARIDSVTVTNGVYTDLLDISGISDINILASLDGYLDGQTYFPVYKLDTNLNVSEFIGCARPYKRSSDNTWGIRMVSIATTFTGNITVSGDLYFNMSKTV